MINKTTRFVKMVSVPMFIVFLAGIALAGFEDLSQNDFSGTFDRTYYNSSGYISINETIFGSSTDTTIYTNVTELDGSESGLAAYWIFNEDSWTGAQGEVKDVLGNYNGTAKSGANSAAGLFNNAGNFSGTNNQRVQIANAVALNPNGGSYTITGWAKSFQKGGANQWQLYVAKRTTSGSNGYYIGLLEGSGLNFMVGDGTNRRDSRDGTGGYANGIAYGQWFHFAAVVNRTTNQILLYVNGTLRANQTISNVGSISNTANLSMGYDEGQNNYAVKGSVDEVAMWNRALTAREIFALYQNGLSSSTVIVNSTNTTYYNSGSYESDVRDAGAIVSWNNLSWSEEVPYGEEEKTNGQALLLHMNDVSGNIADSSSYGIFGTNDGAAYGATGKFGNALSFDGTNDYVDLGNPPQLQITGNMGVSMWVKFNQIPTGTTVYALINKNEAGGYGIIANEVASGKLETYFYVGGAYRLAGVPLSSLGAGRWYHVAGTYDGSYVNLYVDGVKVSSVAATGAMSSTAMPLLIGANPGPSSNTEFFNGLIDEVSLYSRSLSDSEILNMYKKGALDLKFQARTSGDGSSWTEYLGPDNTSGTYYTAPNTALASANSRYIQYKAFFERNSTVQNVRLFNVSVGYATISGISVTLDSPAENYLTNNATADLACSAFSSSQELANITLVLGAYEETKEISGMSNSSTFSTDLSEGTNSWNCIACDVNGECDFAGQNRTVVIDSNSPSLSLIYPDNDYYWNISNSITFRFNASDGGAQLLSCTLSIDNSIELTNSSVNSGALTEIVHYLENGNHAWKVNCSDGVNSAESEERTIIVNKTEIYLPFWAKVNTHMHTTNSDGNLAPAVAVAEYRNRGYNILTVTDHNVVTNCEIYSNYSGNFMCINSEEWTSSTKHLNRINASAHVATGDSQAMIQNAFNTANNEDGFAIINHPNWSSTIWTVALMTALENYTSIEIYNKVIERLSPDPYAVIKWDEILKSGKHVFGVAADDSHNTGDMGFGFTKVFMPAFTPAAYLNAMRQGLFYASQGPTMDSQPFTLNCDGKTYKMGETANCLSAPSFAATISATNASGKIQNITLIKDGKPIAVKTDCPNEQNCTVTFDEKNWSYYRLEAVDSSGKTVWSNPIWVSD
ncbi:MAG: CehA/McbA family metallohydrolase [archaeon]|nr:CehA/McbA family metallohydrolase [archaeon]